MTQLTPRLRIPYPDDLTNPWFEAFKNMKVQEDSIFHALSENDNTRYIGGGSFSWTTATNILSWDAPLRVRAFTSPFEGTIPAQSFEMAEDDVLFFQMFRSLTSDFTINVIKGKVTQANPIRNTDLIAFAYRRNDVIYMPGQKSISSGDLGPLFGGGLGTGGGGTPSDHNHLPELVIEPAALGITSLALPITAPVLLQVRLYRNGLRMAEGVTQDYTVDLGLGIITLNLATQDLTEKFVVDMIRTP